MDRSSGLLCGQKERHSGGPNRYGDAVYGWAGDHSRTEKDELPGQIIAASGFTAGNKAGEGPLEGVNIFLSKPYTAEKLLKALAQVLKS